jgi:hypothetical protein
MRRKRDATALTPQSELDWSRSRRNALPTSVRVLGTHTDDKQGVGKLIGYLHPPIAAWLQFTVQTLEDLAGGDCRFLPGRMPVGQFFPDLVRFGVFMVDVEEVFGHQNQRRSLCLVPDIVIRLVDCCTTVSDLLHFYCLGAGNRERRALPLDELWERSDDERAARYGTLKRGQRSWVTKKPRSYSTQR